MQKNNIYFLFFFNDLEPIFVYRVSIQHTTLARMSDDQPKWYEQKRKALYMTHGKKVCVFC